MKIIYEMPTLVQKILRTQKIRDDAKLRKSHFWVETDVAEGTLLYHTMTKEFLLLEPGEADTAETQKYLADHWFLVPEELDECKLSDQLKDITILLDARKPKKGIKRYTILTTTDCNARCFYCFEHGGKKMTMDEAMAQKVAAHIIKTGAEDVVLSWFGGEPLYNADAIDTICTELNNFGHRFKSTMLSNGYLFDSKMIEKAVSLWNLKLVQITLDGTEEIYNKRKAYIYRDDSSAFQRVLHNIKILLDSKIHVRIRLNLDDRNADDLEALCKMLAELFGAYDNFTIYPVLLYQEVKQTAPNSSGDRLVSLYKQHEKIQRWLRARNLFPTDAVSRAIQTSQCMADSGNAVVIQPDGALLTCDHYNECQAWGHIESDHIDTDVINAWKEYLPSDPSCSTCALYPNCYRLRLCPCMPARCHPLAQENGARKLRWAMQSAWEKFNSEGNIPDEESEDI